jgi:hypothetical protein
MTGYLLGSPAHRSTTPQVRHLAIYSPSPVPTLILSDAPQPDDPTPTGALADLNDKDNPLPQLPAFGDLLTTQLLLASYKPFCETVWTTPLARTLILAHSSPSPTLVQKLSPRTRAHRSATCGSETSFADPLADHRSPSTLVRSSRPLPADVRSNISRSHHVDSRST